MGMWYPLSLEMQMTRPQLPLRIDGTYSLERRAPLSTFTSKNRRQSASEISSNALTSKMPRLFTRISTTGCWRTRVSATESTLRSPANPITSPLVSAFIAATADSTAAGDRPLTMTVAPSRASEAAMALPIPAVEPVTSAIFFANLRSMRKSPMCEAQMRSSDCIDRSRVQFVNHPILHHEADALHETDVVDRIAGHRDDVGDLARRDAAQILVVPQQLRGADGRRLNGEHRRHAGSHHQLELMCILPRIDG